MNGTSNPSSTWMTRLARLLRPGGNPLARGADRVEGLVLIAVILVGLFLLPVMLVFGSLTYESVSENGEEQARTRHEVVGTLTEDAPAASAGATGTSGKSPVPVQWELPDGSVRTGPVQVDDGLKAGARVDIWIDQDGRVVRPPATPADAVLAATTVAVVGWLVVVGSLALAQYGLHRALDRRRYRAWDRDWERAERDWNSRR